MKNIIDKYIIMAGYLEYGIGNFIIFKAFKNWEKK